MARAAGSLSKEQGDRTAAVIFVTLGTHAAPMDRLLRELDRLVESGELSEPVIVQTATARYAPRRLHVHGILPYQRVCELVEQASAVICHAGPATLALVRSLGRTAIVVPRSPQFGEHVDDHQERYAQRLRRMPGYIVVDDVSDLSGALAGARRSSAVPVKPDVSRAVDVLEELMREP